ncbi:metal-binding protein [Methylomonas sp. UP202]|nr:MULTISPECIES: metal-binding protein [Methylomonas]WGS84883.1 metal-binding protein [Methylomonas sp. UP202]
MPSAKPNPCALCGQPVKVGGFKLLTGDGLKRFCCEGCRSIFQLLNAEQTITTIPEEKLR